MAGQDNALPPGVIEQARANPGGYVYVIGGGLDPMGDVPFEAIIGWFKVDPDGHIRTPFEPNLKHDAVGYPPNAQGSEE